MMRSRYFALALALIPLPALAQTDAKASTFDMTVVLSSAGKPLAKPHAVTPVEKPIPEMHLHGAHL